MEERLPSAAFGREGGETRVSPSPPGDVLDEFDTKVYSDARLGRSIAPLDEVE
jgi:hypothetical protein